MFQAIQTATRNLGIRTYAVAATLAAPVISFAQTVGTDPFDAALTTVTEKTGVYAAALVGVSAVAVVFMVAMKYVKKLPRAS